MGTLFSFISSRLARVYQHVLTQCTRFIRRFQRHQPIESEHTPEPQQSIPVTSVQWRLDCPYSEKPQYTNTVVYIDLHPNAVVEDLHKKITHYPPTHRLH